MLLLYYSYRHLHIWHALNWVLLFCSCTWHCTCAHIKGAGFWGTSNLLYNMSAFQASANGDIGTIYCHSSSNNLNVGQWISPEGVDITSNHLDPFSIQFRSGSGYHSYNTFQLLDRLAQPFTTSYDGVYSCIVPDDQGIMQTLHIGIYSNEYSSKHLGVPSRASLTNLA